jgi:hypothetical protein
MPTGSESLPANKVRGLTSRRNATVKRRSASVPICTGRVIWSSGSSIRSSSVGASQLDMTSLQPTISPSSSWHQSGYGCTLMSPRPSCSRSCCSGCKHQHKGKGEDRQSIAQRGAETPSELACAGVGQPAWTRLTLIFYSCLPHCQKAVSRLGSREKEMPVN